MANEEHVKLLLEGGSNWNRWRGERPQLQPDLHGAELTPTLHKTQLVAGGSLEISRRIAVVCGPSMGVGRSHVA